MDILAAPLTEMLYGESRSGFAIGFGFGFGIRYSGRFTEIADWKVLFSREELFVSLPSDSVSLREIHTLSNSYPSPEPGPDSTGSGYVDTKTSMPPDCQPALCSKFSYP